MKREHGDLPRQARDECKEYLLQKRGWRFTHTARTEVLYGQHDDSPNEWPGGDPEGKAYDDAIRVDIDGAAWKLIEGWGGKPNSWSQLVNGVDVTPDAAVPCEAACCVDGAHGEAAGAASAAAAAAGGDVSSAKRPPKGGPGSPTPAPAYNKTLILFDVLSDPGGTRPCPCALCTTPRPYE